MYLAIGIPAGSELKPTSISFFILSDLCQYVEVDTGVGMTTPAVYKAYQTLVKFTLLVISLIKTGASLLALNFL